MNCLHVHCSFYHTLLSILDVNTFRLRLLVKSGKDLLLLMLSKHLSLNHSDRGSNSQGWTLERVHVSILS